MEPHQQIQLRRVREIARDEQLTATRIDLARVVTFRTQATTAGTFTVKAGVASLKLKRKVQLITTATLVVTRQLGGVQVWAADPAGKVKGQDLALVPLLSFGEREFSGPLTLADYQQLADLALLREDAPAELPVQVDAQTLAQAQAEGLKATEEEARELAAPKRRKKPEPAPQVSSEASNEANNEPDEHPEPPMTDDDNPF